MTMHASMTFLYDGQWDERNVYMDFNVIDIFILMDSSIAQCNNCILKELHFGPRQKITCLTLYRNGFNRSAIIKILEHMDVFWVLSVISSNICNDCCVVLDVKDTEVDNTINTQYVEVFKYPQKRIISLWTSSKLTP